MAIGGLALAGFGLAVKASADFEKQLSHFQAVTGAVGKDMDAVREKALQLGRDSAYGAGEVATAFTELAKAGVTAQEIVGGVGDAAVTLAAAADVPIQQAAVNLVNLMRTFSLTADQATHVADVMAGAANASTIEVDDLATSLKYAGSVAATLKIPFESVADALAILGNAGIRGSTGGTSLRRILLNLTPASEKAATMMEKLGIITKDGANLFFDASGKAKDLAGVAQVLQDHLKGLTDQEKVHALNVIFGNRAVSSAAILAKEGAAGFKAMHDQVNQTTALDVMNKRLDNLSGALKIFKSSIETAFIRTGTAAQKPLTDMVRTLTKWVNAFASLSPHTQEVIAKIVLWTGTILVAVGAGFKIVAAIMKVIQVIKLLGLAFQWLGESLLANPVFLIIAAIIALGIALYVLYKKNEAFRKFIDGLWQGIQKVWDAILGFFQGLPRWFSDRWKAIANAFKVGVDWVKKNWDLVLPILLGPIGLIILVWRRFHKQITGFIGGVASAIGDFGKSVGRTFMDALNATGRFFQRLGHWFAALPGVIGRALSRATDAVVRFVKAIPEFLGQLPHMIAYALGFAIGSILRWAVETWMAITDVWNAIIDFFKLLPGRIVGALNAAWDATFGFFDRIGSATWQTVQKWWDAIIEFFKLLPGRIVGALVAAWDATFGFFDRIGSAVWQTVQRWWDSVIEFFKLLPGRIVGALNAAWDATVGFFERIGSSVWQTVQRWWDAVINFFIALPGRISSGVSSAWSATVGFFSDMGVAVYNAVKGWIESVIDFFVKLPGRIWDAIKNLASSVGNWFKGIGHSMWQGFKDAIMGSPKTKIEYTLLDMVGTTEDVVRQMNDQMRWLENVVGPTLPLPGFAAAGITPSGQVAANTAALAGGSSQPVPEASGDHYEFHEVMADPIEIAEKIAWKKRVKSRVS